MKILCFLGAETKTAGWQQWQQYTLKPLIGTIFIMSYASLRQKTFLQCESVKKMGCSAVTRTQTYMAKEQHVSEEWNWFGVTDATSLQDRIRGGGIPVTERY